MYSLNCSQFHTEFLQWMSIHYGSTYHNCHTELLCDPLEQHHCTVSFTVCTGERGGSVVECRTPEREVRVSRPTAAVLCPWARHFTPRKYWLITQEAMAPSRHDWKIVDWDVKPQHNQNYSLYNTRNSRVIDLQVWRRSNQNWWC